LSDTRKKALLKRSPASKRALLMSPTIANELQSRALLKSSTDAAVGGHACVGRGAQAARKVLVRAAYVDGALAVTQDPIRRPRGVSLSNISIVWMYRSPAAAAKPSTSLAAALSLSLPPSLSDTHPHAHTGGAAPRAHGALQARRRPRTPDERAASPQFDARRACLRERELPRRPARVV